MKILFLLGILCTFINCTYNEKPQFIRVDSINVGTISTKTVNFKANAVFANSNTIGGKLATENIDIIVNEEVLGHLKAKEFQVPARDTFSIPLEGKILTSKILSKSGQGLLGDILSIIQEKKVTIGFKGTIQFKKGPFTYNYLVDKTEEVAIKL